MLAKDNEAVNGSEVQPTEPEEAPEVPSQENEAPEEEAPPTEEPATDPDAPAEETPAKTAGEEQAKADEKHRRAGGWQRKIERLEREKEALYGQLAMRQAQPQQPAAPEKPKDAAAQMEEYITNVVAQRLAAERQQEQQQRAQVDFQKRVAEVRAAYPDFDDVLSDVSHIPVPNELQRVLSSSEQGALISYQLAKNPAELARISALPPLDAAREIGRLEAKVSVTASPKTPPKTAIRPPAPPTTVGSKAASTRSLDDLPLADYKRAYRSGRR